ncbi:MAG: PspC domain-containing protein [Panacagrimonas sp.]
MLNNGFWHRLRRYPKAGYIGGVCAGVGHYLDWNTRLIRVLVLVVFFFGGGFPMLLAYLVLWYLMESDPGQPRSSSGAGNGASDASPKVPSAADLRSRFTRMEDRLRNMEACVSSRDYELRRELRKLES